MLFFFIVLTHGKIASTGHSAKNGFLKTALFSVEGSKIFGGVPLKEKNENENSISIEKEIDFLDVCCLSNFSFSTPVVNRQEKIAKEEKFLQLFHIKLLGPPPKS